MAYDEGLSIRIEGIIGDRPGIAGKRMFGGIGFLLHGNMVCGVIAEDLQAWVERGMRFAASLPAK